MTTAVTKDGRRIYERDGTRYDTVTTIIGSVIRKPGLEKWRGDVGNYVADKRMKDGGDSGTLLHQACGLVLTDTPSIPFELPERQQAQLTAFEKWFDLMVGEIIAVEETVYNNRYKYAGTLDFRAILKGDRLPAICDIKSGNYYDAAYCKMQTAAYKNGDGIVSNRRLIIDIGHIKADGLPTIYEFTNHASDFEAFLWTRGIYSWLKT